MSNQLVIEMAKSSSWRTLYSLGFLLSVVLIVINTGLSWSYIAIIVAVGMVNFLFISFYRPNQPSHITGCDIDAVEGYWQLLIQQRYGLVLYEAQLVLSQSFYHCVQLTFETQQPMQKSLKVLIWKDQVNVATWRELKVLTRWSK